MKNKWKSLPLQGKISSIYILANLMILIVNMILLVGINSMTNEIDLVYQGNLHLNELSEALSEVQDNMTSYLSVKSTDTLENYYRSEQAYREMIQEMNDDVSGVSFDRMERNIKNMSEQYLDAVGQTIEAKRGRNVEKYRARYENATILYNYIDTYIDSLNSEQFKHNTENYTELLGAFHFFEVMSVLVMIIVIVGNAGVIIKLAGNIIHPLKELAGQADEVAKGNFDIPLLTVDSKDEIGVVTNAFNQMVTSIRDYIERLRQSMEVERALKEKELMMEAHLKDAQLKYLQAQINPHFLFNTLNAGAQLAMMEGADRTYRYVQNMAEFFRYNVKKGEEIVTVGEEIELVDNYIYILNVRFSGEIHFEKQIDNSLLDVQMPSMISQPVVENSVNHGIREMGGEGKIQLSVYRQDDTVCISIKDNGVGMSRETIEKVLSGSYRDEEQKSDSNGIGMDNVIGRLKLFTECEDVMDINSPGKDEGTEVIIYLQTKEREDLYV